MSPLSLNFSFQSRSAGRATRIPSDDSLDLGRKEGKGTEHVHSVLSPLSFVRSMGLKTKFRSEQM